MTLAQSGHPNPHAAHLLTRACGSLFACLLLFAPALSASAQNTETGTFKDFGVHLSGGPLLANTGDFGLHGEFALDALMIRISSRRYTGYGFEIQYLFNGAADIGNYVARLELGKGKGRFNSGSRAAFASRYLAFMAGYSSGTVWDNAYVDLYQSNQDIEVDFSGVPLMAALGWRRIGGFGLNVEVIGGLTLVTDQTSDYGLGSAPDVMPNLGVRIGFGWDSFLYQRY